MLDFIAFILKEEESQMKMAIEGRYVGMIFDGTTQLGEAMAIIVLRFAGDSWEAEQCLVCVQLLCESLTGKETARKLIHILSIGPNKLFAAMCDWVSAKGVAKRTVKVVY